MLCHSKSRRGFGDQHNLEAVYTLLRPAKPVLSHTCVIQHKLLQLQGKPEKGLLPSNHAQIQRLTQ